MINDKSIHDPICGQIIQNVAKSFKNGWKNLEKQLCFCSNLGSFGKTNVKSDRYLSPIETSVTAITNGVQAIYKRGDRFADIFEKKLR